MLARNYLLFLFLMINVITLEAQCDDSVGNFEDWSAFELEVNGQVFENAALFPEGFAPFLRIFTILGNTDLQAALNSNEDPAAISDEFFGIKRSDESASGDFSLHIAGNELDSYTDLVYLGECDDVADEIKFKCRHLGNTPDSMFIAAITVETIADIDLQVLEDSINYKSYGALQLISVSEDEGFIECTIPMTAGNQELEADSIFLFISVLSDASATGDRGFLIDDIQLSNSTTSVDILSFTEQVAIYPSQVTDNLYIESEKNVSQYMIFNVLGQKMMQGTLKGSNRIDVSTLQKGNYFIRMEIEHSVETKPFQKY